MTGARGGRSPPHVAQPKEMGSARDKNMNKFRQRGLEFQYGVFVFVMESLSQGAGVSLWKTKSASSLPAKLGNGI